MKVLRIIAIIGIILIGIYSIIWITGMYRIYGVPTTANEPTLQLGSTITVSSVPGYNRGDFIVYQSDTIKRIHRLIALEKDILEIKDGIVFVNHENFDSTLKLMHTYVLDQNHYDNIKNKITLVLGKNFYPSDGKYIVMIEDKIALDNNLSSYRSISKKNEPDLLIQKIFGRHANKDNLGPVTIPPGKIFVLGDNRDNSEDSRYFGFVNETDIKGVLLK